MRQATRVTKLYVSTDYGQFAFFPEDSVIGWDLAVRGEWEPTETSLLLELVRPGDAVVDVGANLGWFTVQLARKVGPAGSVLSFEPAPGNFVLLNENIALNGFSGTVETRQVALLDRAGTAEFELSPSNYGDHRIRTTSADAPGELYAESSRAVINVATQTLDDALRSTRREASRIRLLKMDCQGSEGAIARGAEQAFARCDYLATEFWPYGLRRAGSDPAEYLGILQNAFGSFALLDESTTQLSFAPVSELSHDAATIAGDEFRFYVFRH